MGHAKGGSKEKVYPADGRVLGRITGGRHSLIFPISLKKRGIFGVIMWHFQSRAYNRIDNRLEPARKGETPCILLSAAGSILAAAG